MSKLNVYKASAGSGKTYRLALEYIKLLIRRPDAYQNILAVTFTNKAAGEMKNRVLNDLAILCDKEKALHHPDSLLGKIQEELQVYDADTKSMRKLSQEEIIRNASQALRLILHNYAHFQIETIDSFFQRILRHLARELGIGSSFNIELDANSVVEEAVDNLFEHANEDESLLQWIEDFMHSQMEEGHSHRVQDEMKRFGRAIYEEKFQQHRHKISQALKDKDFLKNYHSLLKNKKQEIEKQLSQYADEFFHLLENNALSIDDIKYGKSGLAGFFIALRKGEFFKAAGKRALDGVDNLDMWGKNSLIRDLAESRLQALLGQAIAFQEQHRREWNSICLSLKHLFKIGLLNSISESAKSINREENRFVLSDTSYLLKDMVGDSDASFIFEKIGAHLKHIMIDEFQDTSHLQWNNFRHLLKECLATQWQDSLIVGDVKQSIYRFRNGDWSILNNIENSFHEQEVDIIPMKDNWRSRKHIIDFNNQFFTQAPESIIHHCADMLDENLAGQISKAYQDVEQHCQKKDKDGYVGIRLFDKDNYDEDMMEALLETLKQLQDPQAAQAKVKDICILTRDNKEIAKIATRLHGEGFHVISDEAFELGSSNLLRIIIAGMKLIHCPQDDIAAEEIRHSRPALFEAFKAECESLSQLPLTEMVYAIYRHLALDADNAGQNFRDESEYLFAFMDYLNDYLNKSHPYLGDFLQYWDETLSQAALPSKQQSCGIRMMTIHKAKGLAAHTIIVPFCHWPLIESGGHKTPKVWCEPQEEPYAQMQLLPINYSHHMADSLFEKEFKQESQQMLMDSLNLLYVAFTRPQYNLIVYARKMKEGGELKTVGDLLQTCLEFKDDAFCMGDAPVDSSREEDSQDNYMEMAFVNEEGQTQFRQSNRSKDFIRDEENQESSYIQRGKLLHHLFELIHHQEDVERAVQSLINDGLIARDEKDNYLDFTRKALAQEEVKDWYSGDYQLYNECSILFEDESGHLQERRPDRVVMKEDRVVVIDFKFGKEQKSYRKQVQEYIHLLKKMGFDKVEGYLWYVEQGEIVKC
ncbi:MAG: UvrD-helicase domain-containing protein [Bacteroidales bacterium]|nr:UvrD-helicase domain-containing protein [Bacteroidales bacterium]